MYRYFLNNLFQICRKVLLYTSTGPYDVFLVVDEFLCENGAYVASTRINKDLQYTRTQKFFEMAWLSRKNVLNLEI